MTLGKSLPFVGLGFPTCERQLDQSSLQAHQPGAVTVTPSALALPVPPGSLLSLWNLIQDGDRIGQAIISGSRLRKEEAAWVPGD